MSGEFLTKAITTLYADIRKHERISLSWCESQIVPTSKKGMGVTNNNNQIIGLIPIFTKVSAFIMLLRVMPIHEGNISAQQTGFRSGCGCVDQIFTFG